MIKKEDLYQQKEKIQRKNRILVWICVVLFFAGGCFLWHFSQGKVVGKIQMKNLDPIGSLRENYIKKLYEGKFVEFFHEPGYMERSHFISENGPVIETILLSASDVEGQKIAVTVARRGSAGFVDDPAFQFRQTMSGEYYLKKFQENAWSGVLFEKNTSPFERTVFFEKNGYSISISITSPFGSDGLEEEVLSIVRDFSFSFE